MPPRYQHRWSIGANPKGAPPAEDISAMQQPHAVDDDGAHVRFGHLGRHVVTAVDWAKLARQGRRGGPSGLTAGTPDTLPLDTAESAALSAPAPGEPLLLTDAAPPAPPGGATPQHPTSNSTLLPPQQPGAACLLFPWGSLALHVWQRRRAAMPVNRWMWLKLLVVPLYEFRAGVKAVNFMWTHRRNPHIMDVVRLGSPSVADQVLVEVEAMAGQEALLESLPQICVQAWVYRTDYADRPTGVEERLLLGSLAVAAFFVVRNVFVWWRLSMTSGIARLAASPVSPDEFAAMVAEQQREGADVRMARKPALCAVMLSYWADDAAFFARKRVVDLRHCGL
eukprot:gene504-17445_t